jgi:hypothetical protein
MANLVRGRLLTSVVVSAFTIGCAVAEPPPATASALAEGVAARNHGLVLLFTRDKTTEPPESVALRTCLADHPRLACIPLTLTIKNEGGETVLRSYLSCSDRSIGIDLLMPNGNWQPFPGNEGFVYPGPGTAFTLMEPVCGANGLVLEGYRPGESRVFHMRLADPSLWLDTAFPAPPVPGHPPNHEKGYAILTGPSPVVIRARMSIAGCIASNQLKRDDVLDLRSLCTKGSEVKERFVALQSNELQLDPEHPD